MESVQAVAAQWALVSVLVWVLGSALALALVLVWAQESE